MKLKKSSRRKRKLVVFLIIGLVIIALAIALLVARHANAPGNPRGQPRRSGQVKKTVAAKPQAPAFSKARYSTTDPTSLWVIVNKQHFLQPKSYVPSDLVAFGGHSVSQRTLKPLQDMFAAAGSDGIQLNVQSAYRSYTYQQGLYNGYAAKDGAAAADTYSARPGFSEHQTGLVLDIGGVTRPSCNVEQCFGSTPEGRWLATHAGNYGFIIRYTQANQSIAGYSAEPWHIRYVGKSLASQIQKDRSGSLEQFFSVSGGTKYSQ